MLLLYYLFGSLVLFLTYKLYKLFAIPKELRDVPPISLFKTLLSLARGEPFDVRFENTVKPVLEQQGVARLWSQGKWELIVYKPHHVKEILARVDKYPKQRPGDKYFKKMLFHKTIGFTNILISDGSDWRHHRRISNPAFKTSWSPDMFAQCTKNLVNLIEASPGEPFQVQDLFRRLTLDVLGKGLFSYDFEAVAKRNVDPILKLYEEVMRAMFNPIYLIFPFLEDLVPSRRSSHIKSQMFRSFLKDIVVERKSNLNSNHNDLLTLMIKASIEDEGAQYTEDDVVSDLSVFFLAGHDTTANTLTTMFYFLAKHPEIQEKARQEVNALLNFEKRTPTIQELKEMPYVDCIIKESMRIVSTVPQLNRYCLDGDELSDGLVVPAKTTVTLQLWKLHHDESIYPNPNSFNPDRFMDLQNDQNAHMLTFGSGARMCIGKNFSMLEQRVVIAMLLQTFTVHLGPESQRLETPKVNSIGLLHFVGVDLVFKPVV
ncbi:hypothetical protein DSO57_1012261 [Entomophthora muscae]|uniref:Uncharacterized protein n=1 Tax=Entomophthora muscae TaxID=34485 RepID=A0ACC2RXA7_9FUNG|nr:hypothetical protein DSO57_1012261 [Entomophthora muscae]